MTTVFIGSRFYILVEMILSCYLKSYQARLEGNRDEALCWLREAIEQGKLALLAAPSEEQRRAVESNLAQAQIMYVREVNNPGPYPLLPPHAN